MGESVVYQNINKYSVLWGITMPINLMVTSVIKKVWVWCRYCWFPLCHGKKYVNASSSDYIMLSIMHSYSSNKGWEAVCRLRQQLGSGTLSNHPMHAFLWLLMFSTSLQGQDFEASLTPCIYTRVTLPWLKLWLTQSVEHQRHWGSEGEWDSHKQT